MGAINIVPKVPTQGLESAKRDRHEARAAVRTADEHAVLARVELDGWSANVGDHESRRAAAIEIGAVQAVIDLDRELLATAIKREIAQAALSRAEVHQRVAVESLRVADVAVMTAAGAVLDAEMVDLAADFVRALDIAMALGSRLQAISADDLNRPINKRARVLPPSVIAALACVPKTDDLQRPLNVLRGGGGRGDFAVRLATLCAENENRVSHG